MDIIHLWHGIEGNIQVKYTTWRQYNIKQVLWDRCYWQKTSSLYASPATNHTFTGAVTYLTRYDFPVPYPPVRKRLWSVSVNIRDLSTLSISILDEPHEKFREKTTERFTFCFIKRMIVVDLTSARGEEPWQKMFEMSTFKLDWASRMIHLLF